MTLKEIAALALAEDAEDTASLIAHDRRFHPNGFKDGDHCKRREELEKEDENDAIAASKSPKLPEGISVEIADITKQPVDAIVNAANRWMLGGGGVDGAIHSAAGPSLVEECRQYPPDEHGYRVQTGEAKITGAGNLPSKYVVHTAGPDVRDFATIPKGGPLDGFGLFAGMTDLDSITADGWKELDRLLGNSYRNSMELAAENGAKSIAFPSISTGIFGFPLERAVGIAAQEIAAFRDKHPDVAVKMCIYDPNPKKAQEIKSAYESAFADFMKEPTEDADETAGQAANPPANPAQMTDLQKHDAKYHPNGYKKGDKCKYRENLDKGDNADQLDPENVEGDTDEAKPATSAKSPVAALQTKVGTLMGLLGNLKNADGLTAELVKRTVGNVLGLNASSAPKTKTAENPPAKQRRNPDMPEAVENAVLAAKINPSWYTKQGTPTPQGATVFRSGDLASDENSAKNLAETMAKSMPKGWTVGVHGNGSTWEVDIADKDVFSTDNAYSSVYEGGTGNLIPPKTSTSAQFGPRPSLTNDESDFPDDADFDFGNYGKASSGYHSAGSGSTHPHWIDINGQRYYVKQAGNNPTYNNDAAQNEVNANKFLRMAGLLAPESKLYTENGVNYCVTKALPHSGNLATGNLGDPSVKKQLEEAYPVMDLMYNTDILQNDNAYIDKNGDIAFIDNGSSFGTSAQGTRNSKQKFGFDYDHRSDPYSGNPNEDYGALSRHSSQAAWNQIAAGTDINEQAAKWNLGALAKEAISEGLVPKQAQSAFQQFADAIDDTSDKMFPNLRPGKAPAVSSATVSSPSSANAAPSATPQSSSSQGGTASTSQAQSASATPQPQQPSGNSPTIMPNGAALFNAMQKISPTWQPNLNTRQSRNATGFLNAVAAIPQSAVASAYAPNGGVKAQANKAIAAMLQGTFTANKSGVGGVVTGASIPRKGVQALGKYLNQIMNPQGYKIQIHNNGNVTISASNRGIANAAMQAAGMSPAPTASASSQSAASSTPQSPAPSASGSATSSSQAATASPGNQTGNWKSQMNGMQLSSASKSVRNAYNTVANWLNAAQQNGQI